MNHDIEMKLLQDINPAATPPQNIPVALTAAPNVTVPIVDVDKSKTELSENGWRVVDKTARPSEGGFSSLFRKSYDKERVNQAITLKRITELTPDQANEMLMYLRMKMIEGVGLYSDSTYELDNLGGKSYQFTHFGIKYEISLPQHIWGLVNKIDNCAMSGKSVHEFLRNIYLEMIDTALSMNKSRKPTTQKYYYNTLPDYLEESVANYLQPEKYPDFRMPRSLHIRLVCLTSRLLNNQSTVNRTHG